MSASGRTEVLPHGAPNAQRAPAGAEAAPPRGDEPGPRPGGAPDVPVVRRYRAFVSYSHRDAKAAAALQRAIETYRLPKHLVGRGTPDGPVPRELKPLFRDRDELQAGADLGATVREALSQSWWLIVVCSPDAARSPWVQREIVEFKRLHGEGRVLALIVAGEPYASRTPGREADECFPLALRHALDADGEPRGAMLEPIAADARPHGDGKRLAMLKLIAGMLGLGVDELVRRDAQRRVRRFAWLATASAGGALAMGVMAVLAVQARNDAQQQRAQAEDLIEFMLGDLRKKLEPVGRLEVLDAVGEKALGYYAKQEADTLDAKALGHRSRAMHLIGEIREQRGQLEAALDAFKSAAETTGQLLARAPQDAQRIFDHAQSVFWVGYIAWQRREADVAEQAFLEYQALAQRLVALDPGKPQWLAEVAYAAQNLGVVKLETAQFEAALKSFAVAKDVFERLRRADSQSAVTFDLAHTEGWIAQAYEDQGMVPQALEAQGRKRVLFESLPGADRDQRAQRGVANALTELSRLSLMQGDVPAALAWGRQAADKARGLAASDQSNAFWRREACYAQLALLQAQRAAGELASVRSGLIRLSEEVEALMRGEPNDTNAQVNLQGAVLALRAAVEAPHAALRGALSTYLAKVSRLEVDGRQLDAAQQLAVADVTLALADGLAQANEQAPSQEASRAVVARLTRLVDAGQPRALTLSARAEVRLGDLPTARRQLERIDATGYRHPSVEALRQEMAEARAFLAPLWTTGSISTRRK